MGDHRGRSAPGKPPELLERAAAVATLMDAVRGVADGASAVAVVHGPPGTGRSTMLAQAETAARQLGLRVVTANCTPADGGRRSGVARDLAADKALIQDADIPVAILVDNAQWADPYSVRVARAALHRPAGAAPLLLVVAGHDPLVRIARTLRFGGVRWYEIGLRPLSPDGVRTMLATAYGPRVHGQLVAAAVTATAGNPVVLRATLHRCPEPPAPDEFAAVADQVGNDRVRRTLAALPAATVTLVQAAAAARGDLSFEQVAEIAGIPPWHRERRRDELERTGLFEDAERPRPRNLLAAERALAMMDSTRRRDLYARAARVAHRDGIAAPDLGRLLMRAHLSEPWVLPILHEAGAHSRRLGDFTCAAAMLDRALDGGAGGALRARILVELATARLRDAPLAADRTLRRVAAEPPGPDGLAAWIAAADLAALIGSRAAGELYAAAAGRDSAPSAQRRTLLGLYRVASDGLSADDLPAEPMPTRDVPADDNDNKPGALPFDAAETAAAAWRLCIQGRSPSTARGLAASVLAFPIETALLAPRIAAARVLTIAEDMAAAEAALDAIVAESRRRGVPQGVVWALIGAADLALRRGEPKKAHARFAEAAEELPASLWPPAARSRLTALQVLADLEAGAIDRAEQAAAAGDPDGHGRGLAGVEQLFARGASCLSAGRIDEARALLRECGRLLRVLGCRNPSVVPWRSYLAIAQAPADPSEAAALTARDLAAAQEWGALGALGSVRLWAGLALTDQARIRQLARAVRILERSPARSRHALALVELSAALLDGGEPARGRATLSEALRALKTDDAPSPRAHEVAARYDALAGTARERLTPAQLRVTLLAATGRANAQIARELSITRRTVELHLTNSYRTLGVNGRADLAATLGHADADPETDPVDPDTYSGGNA